MNRTWRLAAAAAAVLVVAASPADAQDSLPGGWGSSTVTVEGTRISGAMQRDGTYWDWRSFQNRSYQVGVKITIERPADLPASCSVPVVEDPGTTATRREFAHDLIFECNGTYPVTVTGTANSDGGSATIARSVAVQRPAPAVTGVEAELGDDTVTLRWDDMAAQAKDLTAYRVSRRVDGGSPKVITEVTRSPEGALPTTAEDADLPETGEVIAYEVVAVRYATGPGPSAPTSQTAITRAGEEVDPPGDGEDPGTDPGDGSDSDGSAGPGDEPADPTPTTGGPGGEASPRTSAPRQRVSPPRVGFSRSFLPPLLRPDVSPDRVGRPSTTTTVDGGYDEDLPYNPVDGPLEPELPDDELAGFFTEQVPGRGMAIPVATALVLAGWAMHLRALARAGRPNA